ncbi:MAG: 1-acyl-sn-glycerol-3-phosphate acyltransferase [Urechidicola sp.]|jgi:1-acyl-sn-glycerol-3-phosphate acyltransferase|tara:strand:- start:10483 stop:11037 length:555 start_codon:yes stop_codon:yes gene_type:complete
MKKGLAKFVLWITGWKPEVTDLEIIKKSVMVAAPHTSNWDLIYMVAIFWQYELPVKFFIKDSYTKGLHGGYFRWLGGIGINRKQAGNKVETAAKLFEKEEKLIIIIPPEGTRKRVDKWKKGFYHIAKKANVPVSFGFLDYKNKNGGVGGFINLTDSFENDMEKIQAFYKRKTAKFPENYNQEIY